MRAKKILQIAFTAESQHRDKPPQYSNDYFRGMKDQNFSGITVVFMEQGGKYIGLLWTGKPIISCGTGQAAKAGQTIGHSFTEINRKEPLIPVINNMLHAF